MRMEHIPGDGKVPLPEALAIVCDDALFERLVDLYFSYHPTHFPSKVFREPGKAEAWIHSTLEESQVRR